jgi:hypothetical protein
MSLDSEWMNFVNTNNIIKNTQIDNDTQKNVESELYISTKSKIFKLDIPIDLNIFWNIPITPYDQFKEGIIKKQMQFVFYQENEYLSIQNNYLVNEYNYYNYINYKRNNIDHIFNKNKIFKDIWYLSIGISKNNFINKNKKLFVNCFILIMRIKLNDLYKEFHIKIFDTGKIEIPGIKDDSSLSIILRNIKSIFGVDKVNYCETILINSNFDSGYYFCQNELYDILKNKYFVQSFYDTCCFYQGIQCIIYYSVLDDNIVVCMPNKVEDKKMTKINMKNKNSLFVKIKIKIFRTGKINILGKFEENVLYKSFDFIKNILNTEYQYIYEKNPEFNKVIKPLKNKKIKYFIP